MDETPGGPADVDLDAYLQDPDAELHRCAAAHWYANGLGPDGSPQPWVLSFDDVRAVLRDRALCPRSFVDDMLASGLHRETAEQFTPLFRRTGDDHRRHRALLSAAFTPRSVERLRPVAAAVADRLADDLAAHDGPCDLVATFAARLPAEVFAVLFGLPTEDRDHLARWAEAAALAFMPAMAPADVIRVEQAAEELRAYCVDVVEQRRADPTDDLVTGLLAVEVDGERLDDTDVIATMSGFIFAGAETTRRQLTAAVILLSESAGTWDRLAADPALIPGAVEEVMRHRPIAGALTRVADESFDHEGLAREPGERLVVSTVAANHDPTHFESPEAFDIERPNAADHLTFGWGPHFCVGAGLARMELQESLRVLTHRFARPTVLVATASGGFGAPDELRVVLTDR